MGLSRTEVIEAVIQTAPFSGFAPALNALGGLSGVERPSEEEQMTHHAPRVPRIPTRWNGRWAVSATSPSSCSIRHRNGRRCPMPASCATRPGAGFPCTSTTSPRSWYIIEGEFRMGERVLRPRQRCLHGRPALRERDAHRRSAARCCSCNIREAPTTGARPIYDGRMNLEAGAAARPARPRTLTIGAPAT